MSFSGLTLLEAKKVVARSAAGQNDVDQQEFAGDAIREALWDFNNIRDWTWLQNVSTAANVSTATIDVPSRMKKIYSVTTSSRPLTYINRRQKDREVPIGVPVGGQYFYEAFNADTTGKITIYDAFTASSTSAVTVNYLRLIDYPSANTATFDNVAETGMAHVLAKARTLYLADKGGPPERLAFWERKAKETLHNLVCENQRRVDEDSTFASGNMGYVVPTVQEWMIY